jgi:hypothetical protein
MGAYRAHMGAQANKTPEPTGDWSKIAASKEDVGAEMRKAELKGLEQRTNNIAAEKAKKEAKEVSGPLSVRSLGSRRWPVELNWGPTMDRVNK